MRLTTKLSVAALAFMALLLFTVPVLAQGPDLDEFASEYQAILEIGAISHILETNLGQCYDCDDERIIDPDEEAGCEAYAELWDVEINPGWHHKTDAGGSFTGSSFGDVGTNGVGGGWKDGTHSTHGDWLCGFCGEPEEEPMHEYPCEETQQAVELAKALSSAPSRAVADNLLADFVVDHPEYTEVDRENSLVGVFDCQGVRVRAFELSGRAAELLQKRLASVQGKE